MAETRQITVEGQTLNVPVDATDEEIGVIIRKHFGTEEQVAEAPSLLDHFLGGGDLSSALGEAVGGGGLQAQLSGLMDTATSGYQDEALGAAFSGLSDVPFGLGKMLLPDEIEPTNDYSDMRDQIRGLLAGQQEAHPEAYALGEVLGMVVPGGIMGKLASGLTLGKALPRLAAGGAAEGAAAGYGHSEAEDPIQALTDTAIGGGMGLGLGVAAPTAGVALSGFVRGISSIGRNPFKKAAEKRVGKDIRQTGLTAQDIMDDLATNPNKVVADAHPVFQQRLRDSAMISPALTREVEPKLGERQEGARARISGVMADILGDTPTAKAGDAIMKKMKADSAPLYDEAYNQAIQPTNEMMSVMFKTPSGRAALRKVHTKFLDKTDLDEADIPFRVGADGKAKPVVTSVRLWDEFARVLKDDTDAFARTGRASDARDRAKARDIILNNLDVQSPAFAAARSVWRGGKEAEEALELGRKVLTEVTPALERQYKHMSNAARAMYRLGVFEKVDDMIAKKGEADSVSKIFKSGKAREALKIAIEDDDLYRKFIKTLGDETQMEDTWRMVKNAVKIDKPRYTPVAPPVTPQIAIWQALRRAATQGTLDPMRRGKAEHQGNILMGRNIPKGVAQNIPRRNLDALAGLGGLGAYPGLLPSAEPRHF